MSSTRTGFGGAQLLDWLGAGDPGLEARLRRRAAEAERRLQACAATAHDAFTAEVVGYLVAAGGKRLRPVLALLGAEFGDPATGRAEDAAVIVELVHVASLYHDDVMDQAPTRHGVSSVNHRWGNGLAVYAGDWLLAKAAQLAADLGQAAAVMNAQAANRLVDGQIRELAGPAPGEDPLDHYFAVISGKSAALISMALCMGAVQADAGEPVVAALAEYGEQLGVAFQISDDLLDITSPTALLGKEQGKDLAVGVASLPVLLALGDERPHGRELRRLLVDGGTPDTAARGRALELLAASPAMTEARALMDERLARARQALESLSEQPALKVLDALCDFVALRTA
ncbi:polyprenyl synthetase family protein [Streptomyces sp. NPDC026206]|uniref:polyprenyl synthetase family protein n=1 Tax=Streptomyces sp. NPDC026206 TaxID=3157089 RepID=UPI0033EED9B1